MAGKNEKWVMFRNLIFNEMGITKEDIREWLNDAVQEQAKLIVQNTFARENAEAMVRRIIQNEYRSKDLALEVKKFAGQVLADRLDIFFKG